LVKRTVGTDQPVAARK